MSMDIMVGSVNVGNYTHNTQPMWTHALNSAGELTPAAPNAWWGNKFGQLTMCGFDGMRAGDILPLLQKALAHMDDPVNEGFYLSLEDGNNGWGTFRGAREYFRRFYWACHDHPDDLIEVSC